MLVLSRRVGERIMVGDNIAVVINRIAGNRVTVGIEAPADVSILRGELDDAKREFHEEAKTAPRPAAAPDLSQEFHAPLLAFRSVR
ncbi:MAG: carbon storage regulator [Pirellulaceae bacterium]